MKPQNTTPTTLSKDIQGDSNKKYWFEYPFFANRSSGKAGYALLWMLGIPLPVLLIIYFIRGH